MSFEVPELNEQHMNMIKLCEGGATIYGYTEARLLREVQKFDESLVKLIPLHELENILETKFDGTEQLPYFGAFTTPAGAKYIQEQQA